MSDEPTLADVMARLDKVDERLDGMDNASTACTDA